MAALQFYRVQYKTVHRWDWDNVFRDTDGSLTGTPNAVVVYNDTITANRGNCTPDESLLNGLVCTDTESWIRFDIIGLHLSTQMLDITTERTNQTVRINRLYDILSASDAFLATLEANQEYLLTFPQHNFTDLTARYTMTFYSLYPGDYVIIKHRLVEKPSSVGFDYKGTPALESALPLDADYNDNLEWHWDNETSTLSYIISNRLLQQTPFRDVRITLWLTNCLVNCPQPNGTTPQVPVAARPSGALLWSKLRTWMQIGRDPTLGGYMGLQLPQNNDSVKIPSGAYVVVDCALPVLRTLHVEGVLELDTGLNHTLVVDMIVITGQLIVGWESQPMLNSVEIRLSGEKNSLNYTLAETCDMMGGKGIGVFGGLDLHGRPRNVTWTTLNQTHAAGSDTISLAVPVDWMPGEEIAVSTTSFQAAQTETFRIVAKSGDNRTLTLNATLAFDHLLAKESFDGGRGTTGYQIAAAVGLLSRNIKVIGTEYDKQFADLYGFHILVSELYTDNQVAIGNQTFNVSNHYKGYARISNVEFVHGGQFSQ